MKIEECLSAHSLHHIHLDSAVVACHMIQVDRAVGVGYRLVEVVVGNCCLGALGILAPEGIGQVGKVADSR